MWRSSVSLYWHDEIRMVFQCLWSDFCLTFTTGTPHRADTKSNKFLPHPPFLEHWWPICYHYFDVCKLFIAFQLLRFYWNDLLDWGFSFWFSFVHAVVTIFPVINIFWVLGKCIGWRKRECLFLWFFFFSTQDLRWIKMYANCFNACLCWEGCIICARTATVVLGIHCSS